MTYETEFRAMGRVLDEQAEERESRIAELEKLVAKLEEEAANTAHTGGYKYPGAIDRNGLPWEDNERAAVKFLYLECDHTADYIGHIIGRSGQAVAAEASRSGWRKTQTLRKAESEENLPIPLPGFNPLALRSLREDLNYTYAELGEAANISPKMIRLFEAGIRVPYIYVARRLAFALDMRIDDLVTK